MKKLLVACLLCLFPIVSYAGTATITYTEPSVNQAGNPLTNLKETTIYWKQDGGAEQAVKVPAVLPTGAGVITKVITIADPTVCGSTTVTVQVTASNTNVTNFESVRSAAVSGSKSGSGVGCNIPNAPFNLTITLQ
jgi:hypothetical protein